MIQTKLIRPGVRTMEVECPYCHHLIRLHSNAMEGTTRCLYCRAEFEWQESTSNSDLPGEEIGWTSLLHSTAPAR